MEKIKIGQVFKLRNCEKKSQYQFGKVTSLKPLKLYFTGGATRRGHLLTLKRCRSKFAARLFPM